MYLPWSIAVLSRLLRPRLLRRVLFLISLLICLALGQISWQSSLQIGRIASAQTELSQQVQQGVDQFQAGEFQAAISTWEAALASYQASQNLANAAIVLENLARAYQALGQTDQELRYWEQASATYRQLNDTLQVGRVLTEQAQAYSRLGQYRNAIVLLCATPEDQDCEPGSALKIAQAVGDRTGEAAALGSLGDAYRLRGEYERAITVLQSGLAISQTLENSAYLISAYNSLGNAHLSLAQINYRRALSSEQIEEYAQATAFRQSGVANDTQALNYFQQGLTWTEAQTDRLGQVRLLLSAIPAYYRIEGEAKARAVLQQALTQWNALPDSQEKVYAAIDLAKLSRLESQSNGQSSAIQCNATLDPQAKELLGQAVTIARSIENRRAESFALGELGHLYECQSDYGTALELTRQAQWTADQDLQARDSLYLWQWQAGRIFKAQNKAIDAIQSYEEAVTTLKSVQDDILVASREIRFDFRDTVEPIYRELVELRLTQEQPSRVIPAATDRRENISQALDTLDALKLAELQNYFGNDCVLTTFSPDDSNLAATASSSVIFSTIVLNDRTAVIASFNQGAEQQFEWIKDAQGNFVDRNRVTEAINQYRRRLEQFRDAIPSAGLAGYNPELAQQLYDWVIRPFRPILEERQITTLVFVQDGIFRSVPMAALHDGEQFLIERYAITTTPSLTLTDFAPVDRRNLRALAVGVTERAIVDGRTFPELSYVNSEIQAVKTTLPGSFDLLNQDFTRERLQQQLDTEVYPIIHIATHGTFSAEAENAFLVTGFDPQSQSQKLTINDLDDIIRRISARNPVDLLVLSACQTAAGDDRAALGLAGIAAQAGARSVLASLWSVNDPATTQLVEAFYQNLVEQNMTKAEALRSAQLALIQSGDRTAHPAYWSAFILIGNWL